MTFCKKKLQWVSGEVYSVQRSAYIVEKFLWWGWLSAEWLSVIIKKVFILLNPSEMIFALKTTAIIVTVKANKSITKESKKKKCRTSIIASFWMMRWAMGAIAYCWLPWHNCYIKWQESWMRWKNTSRFQSREIDKLKASAKIIEQHAFLREAFYKAFTELKLKLLCGKQKIMKILSWPCLMTLKILCASLAPV